MTNEEYEISLKNSIKLYENNYISYKKLLEDMFKFKIYFPENDEFVIWYKNH